MIRRAFALLSLAALTTGCKDSKCHIDDLAPEDCTKADCLSWGGSDWTDSGFANPLAAGPGGEVAVRAQDGVQLLDPDGKPLWTTELTAVLALAIAMDGDVLALTADFERDEMHLSRLGPTGELEWTYTYENLEHSPHLLVDHDNIAWFTAPLGRDAAVIGIDENGVEHTILRPETRSGKPFGVIEGLALAPDDMHLVITGAAGNPNSQRTAGRSSGTGSRATGPTYTTLGLDSDGNQAFRFQSGLQGATPGPCGTFFGVAEGRPNNLLQRVDADGTVLWERELDSGPEFEDIAWDGQDTLYVLESAYNGTRLHRFHVDGAREHAEVLVEQRGMERMAMTRDGQLITNVDGEVTAWRR